MKKDFVYRNGRRVRVDATLTVSELILVLLDQEPGALVGVRDAEGDIVGVTEVRLYDDGDIVLEG